MAEHHRGDWRSQTPTKHKPGSGPTDPGPTDTAPGPGPAGAECLGADLVEVEAWRRWLRSRDGRHRLHAWADTRPELHGWAPDELEAPRSSYRTDRMQAALVDLSQGGEGQAALTLLVQLRPGLMRLVRSARVQGGRSWPDAADEVRAVFFETVCRHPLDRRPSRIAANLLLDTRQRMNRASSRTCRTEASIPPERMVAIADRGMVGGPDSIGVLAIGTEVRQAVRRLPGTESSRRLTATLAARAWFLDEPEAAIADDLGLARSTVAKRLQRLRTSLRVRGLETERIIRIAETADRSGSNADTGPVGR